LETWRIELESTAIFPEFERPETMRICRLCNKTIEQAKTFEYQIGGQTIWIGTTVHDDRLAIFEAEQARRKPYRQPLEDPAGAMRARIGTMIKELTETVREDW